MIFRRRQDEMEGFRRMREALRQQADPNDHALLDDDEAYEAYDEDEELDDDEAILVEDELVEGEPVTDDEELDEDDALDDYAPLVAETITPTPEARPVVEARPAEARASEAPPAALTSDPLSERQVPARSQPSNASMTTIGADTTWNGTLRSESNIYLEGRVEGIIEVRDTIYVAERAQIEARVTAHSVVVSGHVSGQIDCEGRLEVTPTGRVSGEVVAGSLVVHEGAVVDGKIKMKSGVVAPTH